MRENTRRWAEPAIALLALMSSCIGIVNRFTYDDRYIIELNPLMQHGLHGWWRVFLSPYWPKDWGGDGYRPITLLAFKLESAIGGGLPVIVHAANILLYVLVAVLVYRLACRLLPQWAAWIAAALFAVHPVHVEAVANGVGQSELLVAAAVLGAIVLYLGDRMRDDGTGALQLKTMLGIGLLYAIACFSKEHGVVLPALLIAAELTIIDDRRPAGVRATRLRPFYLGLLAVGIGFMAAHSLVPSVSSIGGFYPFMPFNTLHTSTRDRVLTAIGVVPQWVRLFYWPAHLSSEYGPPDIEIAQGLSVSQLPGFLLLGAILAFGVLLRKRQRVISFGIWFVCLTLLPSSNFVVTAGIVLAERTLFLPSVGAMLIVGGLVVVIARLGDLAERPVPRHAAQIAVGALLVAGAIRSITRTRVWHDNDTLFHQAVIDSPWEYRAHYMLGAWDFEQKRKREGESEYRKALKLFPYDPALAFNLAEQYRLMGLCEPAIPLYRWSRAVDPHFPMGHTQLSLCLLETGQYDEAKTEALTAIGLGGQLKGLRRVIFLADSAKRSAKRVTADTNAENRATVALAGRPSKLPEAVQKTTANAAGAPVTQRAKHM